MNKKILGSILIYLVTITLVLLLSFPIGYFVLGTKNNIHYRNNVNTNNIYSGIGAYIINLEHSKKRYEYVKNNVAKLKIPLKKITAINGKMLSQQEIVEKVDLDTYKKFLLHLPKLGTIGCFLSHIKTWQTFLDSNYKFAVIFEDDVSFDPQKLRLTIQNLMQNSNLWDITSFELSHNGTPLTIKSFQDGQKLVVYLTNISHTGAYIINRKAAQNMLEKALPIKMPIDHYFTRAWEFNLKFTGIENPRLVHQTFGESDIASSHRVHNKEKPSILLLIKRSMYKLQSYTIRFLYNAKVYIILLMLS